MYVILSLSFFRKKASTELQLAVAPTTPTAGTTIISALDTFWRTKPYVAAAITCGLKASTADFVAQKSYSRLHNRQKSSHFQRKNINYNANHKSTTFTTTAFDWKRNAAYMLYGAIFQGMVQEFALNRVYPVIFGPGSSLVEIVAFSLLVWTTLVMLPTAYLTKALILGHSIRKGIQNYLDDIRYNGLLHKCFLLWTPAHFVTFGLIPQHWRVTFIASVSFFWLILFSSITSNRPTRTTVQQ